MRCRACDCNLNDFESTRKSKVTKEYLDLCNHCYSYIKDDLVPEAVEEHPELEDTDHGWEEV